MKKVQNPEYYFVLDGPQDLRAVYIRKTYDDYTGTSFGLPTHHAAIAEQCRVAMADGVHHQGVVLHRQRQHA